VPATLRSVALAVLFLSLISSPASAGVAWCEDDPLITVNGHQLHATVGFDAANLPYLKGKITYVLVVAQSNDAVTSIDASMAALPTDAFKYVITDDQMIAWKGHNMKFAVYVQMRAEPHHHFDYVLSVKDSSQVLVQQATGYTKGSGIELTFDLQ
jgi:hypothetical protein